MDGVNGINNVGETLKIRSNSILKDFCSLTNLVINGNIGSFDVYNNAYNPTKQDIIDGNCAI